MDPYEKWLESPYAERERMSDKFERYHQRQFNYYWDHPKAFAEEYDNAKGCQEALEQFMELARFAEYAPSVRELVNRIKGIASKLIEELVAYEIDRGDADE